MPFDYESFMTGVITGLKLGREPKGRTPPAPSGRYILAESGEHILTESIISEEVTLYFIDEWYPCVNGDGRGYQYQRLHSSTPHDYPQYYFFAEFSNDRTHGNVVEFAYNNLPTANEIQFTNNPDGGAIWTPDDYRPGTSRVIENGEGNIYYAFGYAYSPGSVYGLKPSADTKIYRGSSYAVDLDPLIKSFTPTYLITEGG